MKSSKRIIVFILCLISAAVVTPAYGIGMSELGDSIMTWTGFSPVWSPSVRVKNLRVNGNNVTVKTNNVLKDVRWTPENIKDIKQRISRWTLGHEKGNITLYAGKTNIEDLVTHCAKGIDAHSKQKDLTERNIVIYPSHGLYFNRNRQEWIWQRATLWTTVEDLYSQEYVRLIKTMLENAGASVRMPRAGLEDQQPGVSGMPQWTEGARYWLMSQEADSTIWNLYEGDEYKDDMKCRAMWVNSLDTTVDLCLAFHTDGQDSGNDSTIIGTLVIYTAKDDNGNTTLRDGREREKTNRNLADWIQTTVTEDLRHIAPEWTRRQLKEANYCESRVPVVPSIILELLSHKNMADMRYGLDPRFRFAAARAVYKGILRYLNGYNAIVQPLPVQDLGISADGLLSWQTPIDSLEPGATPTYYMVYIQANDGEWDVLQVENTNQLQLDIQPNTKYNFYVVAGNEGGLSFPSPIISAYLNDQTVQNQMVLIVDAFNEVYGPEWFADSTYAGIVPGTYACENYFSCAYIGQQWDYTRAHDWINDDNCGWGSCFRDHAGQLTIGNTHDFAAQHGHVLRRMKISYVSCTQGWMEQHVANGRYQLIDFICGRNKTPLTDASREQLTTYLHSEGRVLLSTDHFSAIDPNWARKNLHASYYAAQASRSGRINTPRHRVYQIRMEPNEEQLFTCHPEALKPEGENTVKMATYEDMRCTAAVGSPQTLVYGFPLETVLEFDKIYKHAIQWLLDNKD